MNTEVERSTVASTKCNDLEIVVAECGLEITFHSHIRRL